MREADQHVWSPTLQAECDWANDDGETMIAQALAAISVASARWRYRLDH